MVQKKGLLILAATIAALTLAGCGGGSSAGNQTTKVQFSSMVTFGDSLSDVGTYDVGTIQKVGGGRWTVNNFSASGAPLPTNYTELLAGALNLTAPCPAQTGLAGVAAVGFNVPVTSFTPQCTNYAQGGSRVTVPYGPGNALTGSPLGALTVPVVTQIATHLSAHGGKFSGTEVVLVLAGANDILVQYSTLASGATPTQVVTATAQAATELVGYINSQILANGAKYVVVMNIPDISTTPFGTAQEKATPGARALLLKMVTTFNGILQAGMTSPATLLVDLFTVSDQQISNPSVFALTNVTDTACNLTAPTNITQSSLTCNVANVIAGDVSHYEFADSVHPTPFGNILLARYVSVQMAAKGWL